MARKYAVASALALALASWQSPSQDAAGTASTGSTEIPVKVTVCQLATDPAAFNHKLVEVSGEVSHGFEEFSLSADHCNGPWLEFGGSSTPVLSIAVSVKAVKDRSSSKAS
jgi:hypothetical protein